MHRWRGIFTRLVPHIELSTLKAAPEMLAEPGCHSRAVVLLRIPPGPPGEPHLLPLPPAPPLQVPGAFPPPCSAFKRLPRAVWWRADSHGRRRAGAGGTSAHVLHREACLAAGVQRQAFAGSFIIQPQSPTRNLPALLPSPAAHPPVPPVSAAPCMPSACMLAEAGLVSWAP